MKNYYIPRTARIGKRFVAVCDLFLPDGRQIKEALLEEMDSHQRLPTYTTEEQALAKAKLMMEAQNLPEGQ